MKLSTAMLTHLAMSRAIFIRKCHVNAEPLEGPENIGAREENKLH